MKISALQIHIPQITPEISLIYFLRVKLGLTIHISGAADSATGSKNRNRKLSIERARYIGKQLLKRGMNKDNIKATSLGGIHQFVPKETNRFGVVLLTQEHI